MSDEPASFADLFDDLVEQLGEAEATDVGAATEYRRRGRPFAVVEADTITELRLNVEVAEAARRTPSTAASQRGADWVRLAVPALDRPTLDRAEAWFLSAWRAAGPSGR